MMQPQPDDVMHHLGGMTFAESCEELSVTITRGDLYRLDQVIPFVEAMASLFSEDFADDLWNLRNGMVPFVPGDEHYDEECADNEDPLGDGADYGLTPLGEGESA